MGDLSEHFSSWEFRCKDGSSHPVNPELIVRLEALRARKGGKPMRIVSGYRSPAYNRRVGGATRSQHLTASAADLEQGYATTADARAVGFRGVGYRRGWAVHVDVRPGTPVVFSD